MVRLLLLLLLLGGLSSSPEALLGQVSQEALRFVDSSTPLGFLLHLLALLLFFLLLTGLLFDLLFPQLLLDLLSLQSGLGQCLVLFRHLLEVAEHLIADVAVGITRLRTQHFHLGLAKGFRGQLLATALKVALQVDSFLLQTSSRLPPVFLLARVSL